MDINAVIPSSPPRASTMDPPSSPFFEPEHHPFTQKSSSPPPFFSSDDSRDSIDVTNYQSPRIYKNKRKGTWWDNHGSVYTTPECKKTKISRNFDSGIYMLSDATESSDDIVPQHISPFPLAIDATGEHTTEMDDEQELPTAMDTTPDLADDMSAAESAFNQVISQGVDNNVEDYDFENQDLTDTDINRIGDLAQIIRDPPVYDSEIPAPGQYRSLVPEHHINLSRNKLYRLVPTLFNVQFLTSLTLRNNQIEELPQAIGKLANLETLNVSLNQIMYLPFEIVQLLAPHGKLDRLVTMGNPLLEPMSFQRFQTTDYVKAEQEAMYELDALPIDLVREDARAQIQYLYNSLPSCEDRDQAVWRIRYFESWANSFDGGDDARECETQEDMGFYPHHPSLDLLSLDDEAVMDCAPRYIARTMVAYYDQAGWLMDRSPVLPIRSTPRTDPSNQLANHTSASLQGLASGTEKYPVIVETDQGTYGLPTSNPYTPPSTLSVPSLFATTLHFALQTDTPKETGLKIIEGIYDIPRRVEAVLERAEHNDKGGYGIFRTCHSCRKEYVVARAEWIEFWSAGFGVFVPVRVAVCSWGCVPRQMVGRPARVLTC
ncbi:hypothetical protein BDW02DRAFT_566718 [Decorospora gaudefroyi]|uniref:L domain-like protein n=1 Tax=Decorospora gaudefroyi TaxID=184978 RepID=A0A6A5KT28_9PLEO|nr:hypothetical protein BDW02DRAFT_566718 [Decorospora gaudefroyi]